MKKRMQGLAMVLVFMFAIFAPVKFQFPLDTINAAAAAVTYSEWTSTTIYISGDIVSYDGKLWIAQWYNQGQLPGSTGLRGVWKEFTNPDVPKADTQSPTVPTSLSYSTKTSNSVSLSWNASTDNVGVTDYEIYKNGTLVGTTTLTSYAVTNLVASTLYRFSVKAKDAAGNISSASTSLSVTTDASAPTNKKLIALSFDDGPTNTTPLVLDKLEKYNVVASFFLVGQNITDDKKYVLERELSLGCELCSHSWTHSVMITMSRAEIITEMQNTSEAIFQAVGVRPKFFRAPYLEINNSLYDAIDLPFICGIGCTDWDSSISAEARATTILNAAKDGDIILLHDFLGNTQTVDALDAIIQGLTEKGFTFVTVSQLFEQKGVNPNVEYKLWTNVN